MADIILEPKKIPSILAALVPAQVAQKSNQILLSCSVWLYDDLIVVYAVGVILYSLRCDIWLD